MDRITNPELTEDPREFIEGNSQTPATPLAVAWLNQLQNELIGIIQASGQTPSPDDHEQLLKALSALSAPAKVDVFEQHGTWLKPKGAKSIHILLIGGGGGGAAGEVKATGTKALGGSGGGGGAVFMATVPADTVPDSVAIVIGEGGSGGESPGGIEADSVGHESNFGDLFYAAGASLNTPPWITNGMFPGAPMFKDGSTDQTIRQMTTGGLCTGMPNGGKGAPITSTNVEDRGENNRFQSHMLAKKGYFYVGEGARDGANATAYLNGWGGAGGSSRIDANAEKGGDGGKYGCGGGGGGAARTGFTSGKGGKGGNGVAVIITHF